MSRAALTFLALLAATSAAGCYTATVRSARPASPPTVANDERWHHGVIWGIAEISGPYDLSEACPQGWAEITTETSFLNGLLELITSGIYASQTVTVRCAVGSDAAASAPSAPAPAPAPAAAPEPAAQPAAPTPG